MDEVVDLFGVVVTNPNGVSWIEGPYDEQGAQEVQVWLFLFGCNAFVLPINP